MNGDLVELHGRAPAAASRIHVVEGFVTALQVVLVLKEREPDAFAVLAKTASRSTLGFMTEIAFELGWIINDKGGLPRSDINYLNHALRRMLWNRGDYVRPIEFVEQRLGARP